MLLAMLALGFWTHADPGDPCGTEAGTRDPHSVESINERYDDFFGQRHREEARERARDVGRGEVRDRAQARARDAELARREFIANRRPAPDARAAEVAFEAAERARRERGEAARRCYVTRKARAEGAVARGRRIPANAEFGLDE